MSEQEYIYIQSSLPLPAESRLVAEILDLQMTGDPSASPEATEIELVGSGRASDARQVVVWVGLNDDPIPEGPPDVRSAADDFAFELYVRAYDYSTADAQALEARWMFDRLTTQRTDTPMLLTHEGVELLAAYLPERGVHDFPAGTEVSIEDLATWSSWVPNAPVR